MEDFLGMAGTKQKAGKIGHVAMKSKLSNHCPLYKPKYWSLDQDDADVQSWLNRKVLIYVLRGACTCQKEKVYSYYTSCIVLTATLFYELDKESESRS